MAAHRQQQSEVAQAGAPRRGLRNRAFASSFLTVFGFGFAQVLRVGSNVILTRLLPPSMFGLVALAGVIVQGLQQFSDVGIYPSIVRSPRGTDPAFLNTAWTLQVIRGTILWIITAVLAWPAAWFYDEPQLLWLLPIAGLAALVRGFAATSLATLNRDLVLGRLTALELGAQALSVVVMIVWALLAPSVWALVAGGVVNAVVLAGVSHVALPGNRDRFAWEPAARTELVGFGRWLFVSTGFSFLMQQGDRLIISTLVSMSVLGIYSMAAQIAVVANSLIGRISLKVLLPLYSRLVEQGGPALRSGVFRARLTMMAATMPIPALLTAFGDVIVRILLGRDFHEAGWMLQLIALSGIVDTLINTIWPVILALGDSFRYMLQVIGRTVLATLGMVVGYYMDGLPGLIVGLAAGKAAGYPVLVWGMRGSGLWMPGLDLASLLYAGAVVWVGRWLLVWVEPLVAPLVG